ncbi:MAG: PAS domain S-box protein [Myxococcales bacterium]|nr:PAS domain S-box protein [Myxococcales bacterium]
MLKTVRVPDQFAPIFEKAQEYVAEFFSQRKDLPEQGTIEIFGQRYILVRASSMSVEFFEMVQKLYADKGEEEALGVARSLLFDIAHTMAIADARSFAERMHVTDPISKLSAGPIQFAHAGFAFVDISAESRPTPDEDFYLLYDHPFSFESDSWLAAGKTTDFPVCVMNAGYASGWCEHSFGVPLVATEILCRAKGDDHCRFIMAHPTRIEGFIADYLRAQPGLAKHVTRYEIPGFFSRKKIEDELAAREEQYRGIFEASTNTLIIVDDAGAIVHANPAASLLFGYATDELRGMELGRLVLDPTFFANFRERMAQAGTYQGEVVATSRSRRLYHLEVRGARFRYQKRDRLLLVFHDITERKDAQLALRRANDLLERRVTERTREIESVNAQLHRVNAELRSARDHAVDANRAKSVFLANMSHELRTPLNAIIGYAELVEEEMAEDRDPDAQRRDLRRIRSSAFHLLSLINDVLDVSKIEAGKMGVYVEEFDPRELIEDVVATVETLAARNLNRLVIDFYGEVWRVAADRTKVRQILYNLLSNACKFTHEGTIAVRAGVVPRGGGEWLEIEVRDSGIGIPDDRLEELFEPFRQADESTTRKYGGTGLGLAITRSFCELMGGSVEARSIVGVGSTFVVRLPREVAAISSDG